jgi:hypothetical protein
MGDNPGGFLPAVLQRVQAQRRDRGGVGDVPDSENAAFLMRLVIIDQIGTPRFAPHN